MRTPESVPKLPPEMVPKPAAVRVSRSMPWTVPVRQPEPELGLGLGAAPRPASKPAPVSVCANGGEPQPAPVLVSAPAARSVPGSAPVRRSGSMPVVD
jgi:hypothetical protein